MTRADMDKVRDDFVRAARFGTEAGFDMLELHMAHGYLLASFLSPLTNRRTDEYGGGIDNRMRFPLEVLRGGAGAVAGGETLVGAHLRDRLGGRRPLRRGCSRDRARAFTAAGVDLIDVSTGQTVPDKSRSTAACGKPRSRTRSATRSASRRWRWATSTSLTMSTRSSPPDARICAPSRVRTWRTPPGLWRPPPGRATAAMVAEAVSVGQEPTRAQSAARRADRRPGVSRAPPRRDSPPRRGLAGQTCGRDGREPRHRRRIAAALAAEARACRCSDATRAILSRCSRQLGGTRPRSSDRGRRDGSAIRAERIRDGARALRPRAHS